MKWLAPNQSQCSSFLNLMIRHHVITILTEERLIPRVSLVKSGRDPFVHLLKNSSASSLGRW